MDSDSDEKAFLNGYQLYDNDNVSMKQVLATQVLDYLLHDVQYSPFKELGGSFSSATDSSDSQAYTITKMMGYKGEFKEY